MSVTLLLADDSVTIQRVVELTFADENIRVVSASDGQQAIQRIETERPDIVLADVGMPKVDGYGVAAHVKASPALRHIPVILLTGAFEPIDEAKARATGCDGILVKPFKSEELIARVRELLAGHRADALWPAELPRVDAVVPAPVVSRPAPPVAPMRPPVSPSLVVSEAPAAPVWAPAPASPIPVEDVASTPPDMLRPANRNPPPHSHRTQQAPRDLPPPADVFESELDMLDVALSRLEPSASPRELDAATASDFARDLEALRNEQPGGDVGAVLDAEGAPANAGRPMFGDWDLPGGRAPRTDPSEGYLDTAFDPPLDVIATELPASAAIPVPEPVRAGVTETAVIPPSPIPLVIETPAPVPAAPVPPVPPVPTVPTVPTVPAPIEVAVREVFAAVPPPVMSPPTPVLIAAPGAVPVAAPTPVPVPTPVPAPPPPPRPSLATAFSALLAAERAQPVARIPAAATLSEAAIEDVVKRVLARMTDDAVHKVVLDAAERIIREEIEHLKSPSNSSGH